MTLWLVFLLGVGIMVSKRIVGCTLEACSLTPESKPEQAVSKASKAFVQTPSMMKLDGSW